MYRLMHLVLVASKKRWPLGLGYDRFYGFIGGETNQWYPELIEDNHFIDQPYQLKMDIIFKRYC
jgi:arylsulfatase